MAHEQSVNLGEVLAAERAYQGARSMHETATAWAEQPGARGVLGRMASFATGWRVASTQAAYLERAGLYGADAIPRSPDGA